MTAASSRTNGFLFSDLRDYTRYVEAHGDAAAATLLESYRALVRAAVGQFGGAEIKTEGDSFYVVFPSASSAVQCGLAILRAAAEQSAAEAVPIRVGIGIHAGETVETAEGYVGSAVNVAARVCGQARAGELLVTDTVRALTRTFLPVRFVDRRQRRLKGIAEPIVMYRVEPATEPAGMPAAKPLAGIGRGTRTAALLAGLLIGGAAAGYVLFAAQRPPGVDSSPTPSTSPAEASFPTTAEADLLDQVPASIRDRCVRAAEDSLAGTSANLRCHLELAAEADTVWYHRYESQQAMRDYLVGIQRAHNLQLGTCSSTVSRAQGSWQVGGTHSGSAYCYRADGSSWIVWTYEADRILARAVRAGESQSDWQGLYDWWSQIRLFVRSSG
jgi:class 3 adenylate cyclase